jgi:NitT/TauT family transport system substrate-binding protein
MHLATVIAGPPHELKKWVYHHTETWQLYFSIGRQNGQITGDFKVEDVVKNDLIDTANSFDKAKVKADADGFQLSDDYKNVDVEAIRAAL